MIQAKIYNKNGDLLKFLQRDVRAPLERRRRYDQVVDTLKFQLESMMDRIPDEELKGD